MAAQPNMRLRVWVLGSSRAVPLNYRHVHLNDAADGLVHVLGKVAKPGALRWYEGMTLTVLIAESGDFQEFANRQRVVLIRKTETGRTRFVVDFDEIIEGTRPDIEVERGDLVYVAETFF